MDATNCTGCRYSQVDTAEDDGMPIWRCHRYPPQLVGLDGEVLQSWPNVGPDDWCGEYMPGVVDR